MLYNPSYGGVPPSEQDSGSGMWMQLAGYLAGQMGKGASQPANVGNDFGPGIDPSSGRYSYDFEAGLDPQSGRYANSFGGGLSPQTGQYASSFGGALDPQTGRYTVPYGVSLGVQPKNDY